MAVRNTKKDTTKASTKDTKIKSTKNVSVQKDVFKIIERHLIAILVIVVVAFTLFALGMVSGAAITIK